MTLTPLFSKSACLLATSPSSVVQTGVKSLGRASNERDQSQAKNVLRMREKDGPGFTNVLVKVNFTSGGFSVEIWSD
jgi:hypothetical protein